jgi:hypothetical protein
MKSFVKKILSKTTYFSYLLSSLKYGILFCGYSIKLKKKSDQKKRAIRLIATFISTKICKAEFKKIKDYDSS